MKKYFEINNQFKKYLPIFMIMLAIIILMSTSYALFKSRDVGTNTYVMTIGTLEVSFQDSKTNALTISNMVPMTDDEGIALEDELEFTVKNTGVINATYSVYIEETSTNPEFKDVVKYISNKNDEGYSEPKVLSEDNYIDYLSSLDVGETATYKVKFWLKEDADSRYMNKTFTARIVIVVNVSQNTNVSLSEKFKEVLLTRTSSYILEDDIYYVSGATDDEDASTTDDIDFNYVWYSGKLWRITAINADGSLKMITQDNITTITYGEDGNFYTDESTSSWIYQWLNEDFLDTLYNYENIIKTDSVWNVTSVDETISTKLAETTMVSAKVGLLNSYEYYKSYQNLESYSNSYLNIGYLWWLSNRDSSNSSCVWGVYENDGLYLNYSPSLSSAGVRPSVNLKSTIQLSGGLGTKSNPYRIKGDKKDAVANTTLLNTRSSGEYVNFDGELYRIVGIENDTTKINKVDYVRDTSNAVIKKSFASTQTYGLSTNTQTEDYWDYYLNNTWYNAISSNYQSMLKQGTYYLGTVENYESYKLAICATASNTVTTKECTKTSTTYTGYVGLPRYGEMFSSQLGSGYSSSSIMWLITPYTTPDVWCISNYGEEYISRNPSSDTYGSRPSINLKSTIKITGGNGTESLPFEISL